MNPWKPMLCPNSILGKGNMTNTEKPQVVQEVKKLENPNLEIHAEVTHCKEIKTAIHNADNTTYHPDTLSSNTCTQQWVNCQASLAHVDLATSRKKASTGHMNHLY